MEISEIDSIEVLIVPKGLPMSRCYGPCSDLQREIESSSSNHLPTNGGNNDTAGHTGMTQTQTLHGPLVGLSA